MNHRPSTGNDDQALQSIDDFPGVAASAPAEAHFETEHGGRGRKNSMSDTSVDLTSFDDIFKNGAKDEASSSDNAEEQLPQTSQQSYNRHEAIETETFDNIFDDANDVGSASVTHDYDSREGGQKSEMKPQQETGTFDDIFSDDSDQEASYEAAEVRQPYGLNRESTFDTGSRNSVFNSVETEHAEQQSPTRRSPQESTKNQSIAGPLENSLNQSNHHEASIHGAPNQRSHNGRENGSSIPVNSLKAPPKVANALPANSLLEASLAAAASMYNIQANSNAAGGRHSIPDSNTSANNQIQTGASSEVIEVLDDNDDDGVDSNDTPVAPPNKRQRLEHLTNGGGQAADGGGWQQSDPAGASAAARNRHLPDWMLQNSERRHVQRQPVSIQRPTAATSSSIPFMQTGSPWHEPSYIDLPPDFFPTWDLLYPVQRVKKQELKSFELSLLNVQEFTITGLPVTYEGPPSSVGGLRLKIKEISKPHGKAVFEREREGYGGKWRIPLVRIHSCNAALTRICLTLC